MSLLHQNTDENQDDAALGESLTKGTSHVIVAAIVAGLVMSVAIAIYVIAGQKPPAAKVDVLSIWAHPLHTETSGLDANGMPMPKEVVDQVMVFTKVRIHDQSNFPLFLTNVLTNVTLDDGIHSSYAANKIDYERIYVAYPDLAVPRDQPISPLDTSLQTGQTIDGTVVSSFKLTKAQWDARKKLDLTFSFRYQPNLEVTTNVPVTEQ